jgi:CBS domain-containing protein
MCISEIMRRDVRTVGPQDTVQNAAAKMAESNSGSVPVCTGGRLVGVMVDRDIVTQVAALGRDPAKTQVREVMRRDPVYCLEDESEHQIVEEMAHFRLAQLPVVNREGRVVGMAALDDVLRVTGRDEQP